MKPKLKLKPVVKSKDEEKYDSNMTNMYVANQSFSVSSKNTCRGRKKKS